MIDATVIQNAICTYYVETNCENHKNYTVTVMFLSYSVTVIRLIKQIIHLQTKHRDHSLWFVIQKQNQGQLCYNETFINAL